MTKQDPEHLLAEGAFVRRLARDLAAGSSDVDDLVQETWLRALRSPPRAGFSPRAWLAGLVRNVARERRRGAERRERREATAATVDPSKLEHPTSDRGDPVALAERFELIREVLGYVGELPESQRQALLMRYLDGLEPAEIARRLGVPDATVRSRIKRGLDGIRARLDAARGGDRGRWMSALLSWAGSPAAPVGAAALGAAGIGGWIVKGWNAAAAIAVVAGIAGLAWLNDGGGSESGESAPRAAQGSPAPAAALATPAPEPAVATREPELDQPEPAADDAPDANALAPPASAHEWRLAGALDGIDPSIPWTSRLRVAAVWSGLADRGEPSIEIPVAADGSFDAELTGFAAFRVASRSNWRGLAITAEDPAYVDARAFVDVVGEHGRAREAPWTFRATLDTRPSARVHGRVVDEHGATLARVPILVGQYDDRDDPEVPATDELGRFELESSAVGPTRLSALVDPDSPEDTARAPSGLEGLLPAETTVDLQPGIDRLVPDLVLARGVSIRGRIVDGNGEPVSRALVLGSHDQPAPDESSPERILRWRKETLSGPDGTFELAGLVPGAWSLRVAGAHALPIHPIIKNNDLGMVDVEAPSAGIELECGLTRVELRLSSDGVSVPDQSLSVQGGWGPRPDQSNLGGRTDADGRFTFVSLPGARHVLSLGGDRFENPSLTLELAETEAERVVHVELELRRPRPALAFRLIDPSARPIGRAWFRLERVDGGLNDWREFRVVAEDDVFTLRDLEPGRFRLIARPGGWSFGSEGFYEEESIELALSEPVTIERSIEVRPTGRLRVFAVGPDGNGVRAKCRILSPDGVAFLASFVYVDANGAGCSPGKTFADHWSFVTPAPPPGRCVVEFEAEGFPPKSIEVEVVPFETVDILARFER